MVTRDLYSNIAVEPALNPATITADADGLTIDTQGYGSVVLAVNVGESGDSLSGSIKIELEVEESDNDSDWTDVADADLQNTVDGTNDGTFAVIDAAAEDDAVYITGYTGTSRYVRVVINVTGSHTNGTPIGATAILGHPEQAPVNA